MDDHVCITFGSCVEFNVPVFCDLIDYKGAFDALNRTTLGRVLGLFFLLRRCAEFSLRITM